jgi:hypothetical protein
MTAYVLRRAPRLAHEATAFWAGMLAFGLSAVCVLAVLSHGLGRGGLAGPSAVLGLSLVTAVLPGALQLAAAAAASRGERPAPAWRPVIAATLALLVLAPALGPLLALPAPAVALVALQLPAASLLANVRGELIGSGRQAAAGGSLALEAAGRLVAGIPLGLAWGSSGLAAALLIASAGALLAARPAAFARPGAAGGPLAATLVPVGLVVLLTNADLLLASRALGPQADLFDASAVPAKGVFLALFAASWLAVPTARDLHGRALLRPALLTVGGGALLTAALVAFGPLVELLLGRGAPEPSLLILLGFAMAFAAGASVCVNMLVARGVRPWTGAALATLAIVALALLDPAPIEFAAGVMGAQALAFLAGLRLLWRS